MTAETVAGVAPMTTTPHAATGFLAVAAIRARKICANGYSLATIQMIIHCARLWRAKNAAV